MPDGIHARRWGAGAITLFTLTLGGCTGATPNPSPIDVELPGSRVATLRTLIDAEAEHPTFEVVQETTDFDGDHAEIVSYESGGFVVTGVIRRPVSGAVGSPAIVFIHGGADTEDYSGLSYYDPWADEMVDRGYVVVMPDLRNYGDSDDDPDHELDIDVGGTLDAINAARAAAADPMIDPERIAVVGHSLGGTMALNAAVVAPEIAAAFVAAAPASAWAWENIERYAAGTPYFDTVVATYGSEEESPEFWNDVSSASFIDRATAPLLVLHGTEDEIVPFEWSEQLVDAWTETGKDVRFVPVAGVNHDFDPQHEVLWDAIAGFLAEKLP
ncbi:alpha/beta hydrolase family protein [Microbacterium sp. HJ5]